MLVYLVHRGSPTLAASPVAKWTSTSVRRLSKLKPSVAAARHAKAAIQQDSSLQRRQVNHTKSRRRPNTYSVDVQREGQAMRVGTFDRLQDAKDALKERLLLEDPDLHSAPERVERVGIAAPDRRGSPEAPNLAERR